MSDIKTDDVEATEVPAASDVVAEDELDTIAGGNFRAEIATPEILHEK